MASPVHTYGFSRGCRTSDVTLTLLAAIALARQYGYGLSLVECDIHRCFDEMDHPIMLGCLLERGLAAEAAAAMVEEYFRITAQASVAGSTCTAEFPFLKGGGARGHGDPPPAALPR